MFCKGLCLQITPSFGVQYQLVGVTFFIKICLKKVTQKCLTYVVYFGVSPIFQSAVEQFQCCWPWKEWSQLFNKERIMTGLWDMCRSFKRWEKNDGRDRKVFATAKKWDPSTWTFHDFFATSDVMDDLLQQKLKSIRRTWKSWNQVIKKAVFVKALSERDCIITCIITVTIHP